MEKQIETMPTPAPTNYPTCVICWKPITTKHRRINVLGDQRMHPAHLTCESLA